MHPHQLLILKNWIHGRQPLRRRVICPQRRKVKDQNKTMIWDASLDRQPKIQSSSVDETVQRIMRQTNNDCSFLISPLTSSLHQQPSLAGRQGPRPRYVLVRNFPRKRCNGSKKWSWLIQWMNRSSSSIRSISMPNFEVLDARITSALNKIIHNPQFHWRICLEEQKAQKEDRFFRGRQIAYLFYDYFRVTGSHDSVENLYRPVHYQFFEMTIFRNSILSETEFFCPWRQSHLMTSWKGLYKLRIRESEKLKTVSELYDLETQQNLGPDYHRLKK